MNRVASRRLMAAGGLACLVPLLFLGLARLGAEGPAPEAPASVPAAASSPATKPAVTRSVWEGVYSKEQLGRGQKAYNSLCARCHGDNLLGGEEATPLVGKEFLKNWTAKSVGALVEYTRKEMPSDGPGKLSRQQCADVTAFLLSANSFPAGSADLATDLEVTNQILINDKK